MAKFLSFFLLPLYTRIFSPSDYGVLDILRVFSSLVLLIVGLEITQSIARYMADVRDDPLSHKRYVSSAWYFILLSYIIFTVLALWFITPLTNILIGDLSQKSIVKISIFSMATGGLFNFLHNQLRWELQSRTFAAVSILHSVISISSTLILILFFKLKLDAIFWGITAGNIIAGTIAAYSLRAFLLFKLDIKKLRKMLSFSLPLVPSSIAVFVANYIDRYALKQLMSMTEVGLYGIGYRLASPITLITNGVRLALTPLIYSNFNKKRTPRDIATIFRYFIFFSLTAFFGISLFSKEILLILTTPEYSAASVVIPWLTAAILFSQMYIFAPGLSIAKKTKYIAIINITTAIMNSIFNFALIPLWGMIGAAFATFISSFTAFLLYIYLGSRYYPIPYEWKPITKSMFLTLTGLLLNKFLANSVATPIIFKLFLFCVVLGGLIYILIGFKYLSVHTKKSYR